MRHVYTAQVAWERAGQAFIDNRYSRRHVIRLDGGLEVPASSSPLVVRVPFSDPAAMDPEEAFVASLSSCHMLWFLGIAAERKFCVDSYVDQAEGVMRPNAKGKLAFSLVTLRPAVRFCGDRLPSDDDIAAMHRLAHEECFIANSVLADVRCEPVH
ncbi:peroxiredoxin [Rhodoferax koreense]|uniref:Peroxiredoxin n=1 Tax=Rhodoferax koreensis TaxID=1842727 RepID=A0A1P8JUH8_9BURK|nr:OsmC family protein [Rhodoferax koreense]APW37388.1 peroxiredoxin [Rhodoferax koreense]